MEQKVRIEDCIEAITGKLKRLPNGDLIVARRSKKGNVHRYQMHFEKGSRTSGQMEHTARFKRARAEADRQLKVKACRVKWEVSFKASSGVIRGKKYWTLRGYVVASCYQMEGTVEESGDG